MNAYTYEIYPTYNGKYNAVILKNGTEVNRMSGRNQAQLTRWAKANVKGYEDLDDPTPVAYF